jgi:uncharacterized membrane protein
MKRPSIRLILIGIIQATIILHGAYFQTSEAAGTAISSDMHAANLEREALEILETKCNVCHKKQNPFMVFKEKNMSKRAKKIYQMVFIERKMPKGNEIRLTNEEYLTLEKWLKTQDIY